jgi:hypothetical protein
MLIARRHCRFQQHANPHHNVHHQAQIYAQVHAQQAQAARTSQQQQQEKNLLSILSQQQRGSAMNGALVGGAVSAGGLGGVVSRNIGGVSMDPRAQATAAAAQAAVNSGEGVIRDVWKENLEAEMAVLRNLVERYPYIAMVGAFAFDKMVRAC